ncbi:hypothetical protein ZIOFF_047562 [Zingiber officinale]|uniref:Uncharacterized protein n=1 Tax=Zingiber officinale TaxID=94328 RepID=A0A8J5FY37_ZINOF|nr:hypothetical protein ZIOFF_047562 [Zingiber officinale]
MQGAGPDQDQQADFLHGRGAARLARHFCEMEWHVLVFLDSHHPNKPEPPYPPHYVVGSGEEDLVPGPLSRRNPQSPKTERLYLVHTEQNQLFYRRANVELVSPYFIPRL